ncbi:MAG: hypothetical protein A7315_11015, partial [Candidatus Altiarchaeales archaeon WOR_SM1_79]
MFFIKNREVVLPGQELGEGVGAGDNCFMEGAKVFSAVQGLVGVDKNRNAVKVIPLVGSYTPHERDVIIGVVEDTFMERYYLNIRSAYEGVLDEGGNKARDRGGGRGRNDYRRPVEKYELGDILSVKVASVNEVNECVLTGPYKLEGGMIMEISPKKVPRVIGKNKSMITALREKTGCRVVVGQNGWAWVKGKNADLVAGAIRKIEEEAHISGLTDRIGQMLDA